MALDVESTGVQTDIIAGGSPEMWRGNDVQFELGFFFDDEPLDATDYSSLTLIVKEQENRNAPYPLMKGVVSSASITPVFTKEEWDNGDKQHCVISFTGAETRLDLKGSNERTFWLAIIARTTSGQRITLGSTLLKLISDGDDDTGDAPPIGASIIPNGAVYNGSGQYVLAGLTANRSYSYKRGPSNDTKLINGAQDVVDGNFVTSGTSVTLIGTASQAVTATLRYPVFPTLDELDQRYQKKVSPWAISPNGKYARIWGVDDSKLPIDQIVDLSI